MKWFWAATLQETRIGDAAFPVVLLFVVATGLPFARAGEPNGRKPVSSSTQWIWSTAARNAGGTAFFRAPFRIERPISRAQLRAAADFSGLTVYLNGRRIADREAYGSEIDVDVTTEITNGANLLALSGAAVPGPSAIAAILDIQFAEGSRQVVATGPAWLATSSAKAGWQAVNFRPRPDDWKRAVEFGALHVEPDTTSGGARTVAVDVDSFDDYTQWTQALGAEAATSPARFLVRPGFQIELLRSARPEEGSWISLAFDSQGRAVIGREDRGLLRMTLAEDGRQIDRVETVNDTLKECRGLLFHAGHLFVNANESLSLYRLTDTDGDDRFDEEKLLYRSGGTTGHGRNGLALGPDGMIYVIHGDAVDLPTPDDLSGQFLDRTSPFREHRRGVKTREGHLLRTNVDGTEWALFCSGLRNPFGIAFNVDGEAFTYDADAEHDMGAPWYRPTRIDHLVSGGDFGWRGVTGEWPPYYPDHPDNALPNLDIGKGSPTAVMFGTKSRFPPAYRRALFVLDWAYGRILAAHMRPQGASYACRAETFVKGRPLNVTGLDFGPDGAMYVVTGGRKTQSGLYRIRCIEPDSESPVPNSQEVPRTPQMTARDEFSRRARALRRRLEAFHVDASPRAIETAWPHLDSPDPWIRHAARIAVEHQPVETWRQRALAESRPTAALTALMAVARSREKSLLPQVVSRLNEFDLRELSHGQKLIALYAYRLCLPALVVRGSPDPARDADRRSPHRRRRGDLRSATRGGRETVPQLEALLVATRTRLEALFPAASVDVNRELARLLVVLDSPTVVEKTLNLLATPGDQKQQLHYLFILRNARRGWTRERREIYFRWFPKLRYFEGGRGMPDFIKLIKRDAVAGLSEADRKDLAAVLAEGSSPPAESVPAENRPFVKKWTAADLTGSLGEVGSGRDLKRGERMFVAASCSRCHRLGHVGYPVGPDLTSVAARFSRRDLLESILSPSKVVAEKYRTVQVVTTSGKVVVGRVVPGGDYRSETLRIAVDPLRPDAVAEIPKAEIEVHKRLAASSMPKSLLDTLTREEILDLLAYIESPRRK